MNGDWCCLRKSIIHGLTLLPKSARSSRLLPHLLLRRRIIGDEAWLLLHPTQRTMHASVINLTLFLRIKRLGVSLAELDLIIRWCLNCLQVLEQQERGMAEDGAGEIDGGENVRSDGGKRAVEI